METMKRAAERRRGCMNYTAYYEESETPEHWLIAELLARNFATRCHVPAMPSGHRSHEPLSGGNKSAGCVERHPVISRAYVEVQRNEPYQCLVLPYRL